MGSKVYLLLGSNEGDRISWLQQCIAMLQQSSGDIVSQSAVYETAAWGKEDQPDFLNMAVCILTALSPEELLAAIQHIEKDLGRQREVKWGQRTLDIDILLYEDAVINLPELVVPHPHMQERRFVLVPLQQIVPGFLHPVFKKDITELLHECPDPLEVRRVYDELATAM
jgi:2-amino-4-hydroxy-6-hydroxymethyldihydropteridine diphosphokinase